MAIEVGQATLGAVIAEYITRRREQGGQAPPGGDIDFSLLEQAALLLKRGVNKATVRVGVVGQSVPIYAGACNVYGVLLRAGALDTILRLADQPGVPNVALDTAKEAPGTRTSVFDGWIGPPIYFGEGIVASMDQIDALAWVFYLPL